MCCVKTDLKIIVKASEICRVLSPRLRVFLLYLTVSVSVSNTYICSDERGEEGSASSFQKKSVCAD